MHRQMCIAKFSQAMLIECWVSHSITSTPMQLKQFTNVVGLLSTLLQYKVLPIKMMMGLQIVRWNG